MLLLANAIEQAQSTDPVAARDALAATKDFQGSTYISHLIFGLEPPAFR